MHLRSLPPGQEMEAEIAADADSRWKLAVIAGHAKAAQVASDRLESGHILVRLRKGEP
ncbi:MAG: hypothetical protein AB1916_14890 [Thermodesulfobacteriota bacterium]